VLVVAGGICWLVWGPPGAEAGTSQVVYQSASASLQTLDKSVSASGSITQAVKQTVTFQASGTVLSVEVEEGETVEPGQTLAVIDTLRLDAARLQAEANLAEAEASLAQAQTTADGGTASDARIAAAEKQVEVAAANLALAEANMDDAVLVAPVAGQVTAVGLAVGDMVTASGSGSAAGSGSAGSAGASGMNPGADSGQQASAAGGFTIVGSQSWSIDLTVPDSGLALLEVGDQAELSVDGVADTVYGVISSLGRVASTSGGSAAFPVRVDITGQPKGLFDGLSATVELIYERRIDVLTVPLSAVQNIDGVSYVDKLVDSVATRTQVAVGETAGSMIEITSGLAEGDQVQIAIALPTGSGDSSGGDTEQPIEQFGPDGGMPFGDFTGDFGGGQFPRTGSGQLPPQTGGRGFGNG
jgi:macrolide-specific efflux system membrane fusion protein